jgi:hypothetical protein
MTPIAKEGGQVDCDALRQGGDESLTEVALL